MKECNDVDLAKHVRELQSLCGTSDKVMRDGTLNAVIDLAANIEAAARALGWRAARLQTGNDHSQIGTA